MHNVPRVDKASELYSKFIPSILALDFTCCPPRNMAASESLMSESVKDPKKAGNIYAFKAMDIDGNMVDLGEKYKGHVCIIVNVASK